MCDCQNKSSFFPYRNVRYSSATGDELRAQCAKENGLDINDPRNQALIDACVQEKTGKGEKVVGIIQKGGNILTNLGAVLTGLFNPAPPAGPSYIPEPDKKGISTGAIIGIVAGLAGIGLIAYFAFKDNKGGK